MKISIVNKYKLINKKVGIYIGRGSPLGNPYVIGTHGTRDEVIDLYKPYLKAEIAAGNKAIISTLTDILHTANTTQGAKLVCFCAPARCHGDVIKEVLQEMVKGQ